MSNLDDLDDDNDGLDDVFEADPGVFVEEIDTGTNPNNPESEGDELPDA